MGSLTLSSAVPGALDVGSVTSRVRAEAASARAVVVTGSEGGLLVGGREDSSSPEPPAAEETSGTKGNDGRNSDVMGRAAMPGKFREGKEGSGGKPRTKMAQIIHPPSTKRAVVIVT